MIVGIALALGSGVFFATGNLAQKRGVDSLRRLEFHRPLSTLVSLLTSRVWILGAGLSVVGVGTQLVAYRHASIAIVQSVGGIGIVVLLMIPRALLHERPARHEIVGAVVAIAAFGLVIASLINQNRVAHSRLVTSRTELAMVGLSVLAALILLTGIRTSRSGGPLYGLGSGILYGAMGIGIKGASNAFTNANFPSAIRQLLEGPIPYSVIAAWFAALLAFQIGIQRSHLSIVAPMSSVISMVTVITVGTPLFGEAWPTSPLYFSMRVLGVFATLVALALALTPPRDIGSGESDSGKTPVNGLPAATTQSSVASGSMITQVQATVNRARSRSVEG